MKRALPLLFIAVALPALAGPLSRSTAAQRGAVKASLAVLGGRGPKPGYFTQNPWTQRIALSIYSIGSKRRIARAVENDERANGPLCVLGENDVPDLDLYKAQLMARLADAGLDRTQVTQGVVDVGPTSIELPAVAGLAARSFTIEPRNVFFEVWKPKAGVPLSGLVWQPDPGFEMSKTSFEWITRNVLDKGGIAVLWDQQWSGATVSPRGAEALGDVDNALGPARDGLVMQHVSQSIADGLDASLAPRVVQWGVSLGGGPTSYGAEVLLTKTVKVGGAPVGTSGTATQLGITGIRGPLGKTIDLARMRPPPVHHAVYNSAFFENTATSRNGLIIMLGDLKPFATLAIQQPDPVDRDRSTLGQWLSMDDVITGTTSRAQTLGKVVSSSASPSVVGMPMLRAVLESAPSEARHPSGKIFIVHSEDDALAATVPTVSALHRAYPSPKMLLIPGTAHVPKYGKAFTQANFDEIHAYMRE